MLASVSGAERVGGAAGERWGIVEVDGEGQGRGDRVSTLKQTLRFIYE